MDKIILLRLNEFLNDELMTNAINEIFRSMPPNHAMSSQCPGIFRAGEDDLSKLTLIRYNEDRNTLLHFVAKNNTPETASRLLQYGVNVQAENKEGRTPMFYAIKNSTQMVQVLLNARSRVNDWNLLRQAFLYGTEETVRLLVNKSFAEIPNSTQDPISPKNVKVDEFRNTEGSMNAFLQHKFHSLHQEQSYPLLMFFAARLRRKDILHNILKDSRKNSAISVEPKIKKGRVTEEGESFPEELNRQGPDGETALLYAVNHQLVDAVRFLLEEGADPNCHDRHQFTPLNYAAFLEHEEICRLLLTHGANANPNFENPDKPLNLVCGGSLKFIPHLKVIYFNNCTLDITKSDFTFNPKIMKLLLANGANPDSQIGLMGSVLFAACKHGRLEEVKILLQHGANVNFENCENCTPLMFVAKQNHCNSLGIIEYLVTYGANINAMNNRGQTALHIAICNDTVEVERFLELGADWTILNVENSGIIDFDGIFVHGKMNDLISFTALKENELIGAIKSYFGNYRRHFVGALEHFEKSKLEITKLKAMIISKNLNKTYFDFLTKDFYSCVLISRNLEVTPFWRPRNYKTDFPCYASLLQNRFNLIRELEHFVDKTFDFFLNDKNLMPEIAEMIMVYLRPIDFRIFGGVLSNE